MKNNLIDNRQIRVFIIQKQAPEKVHQEWVQSFSDIAYQVPMDTMKEVFIQ